MIIGWDISTKCIGWCILNDDGTFVDVDYIWLQKLGDEYDKLERFIEFLDKLSLPSKGLKIFVEAPLKRSNNQHVVNILQRWNGFCCAALYQRFGVKPVLIPERDVRKLNGIIVPKGTTGVNKKKYVLQCVQELGIIPEEKWKYKRTGTPKDFCFDMSDSYWVAKAGYLSEIG